MKWFLLLGIKLYWKIVPSRLKRCCLFKESCSNYVYRQTKDFGFIKGIESLMVRLKQCRNGYNLYSGNDGFEMELSDGCVLKEQEISEQIIKEIYEKANQISTKITFLKK